MQFLQNLAYQSLFGFPVVGYLGILGYLFLIATASVMVLNRRKLARIKPKYHFILARITIIIATIHGVLAISVYL